MIAVCAKQPTRERNRGFQLSLARKEYAFHDPASCGPAGTSTSQVSESISAGQKISHFAVRCLGSRGSRWRAAHETPVRPPRTSGLG